MKHENILQLNISRLVKTTRQSETPSDTFTDNLIAQSLHQINTDAKTFPLKAIAACAAVLLAATALTIKLAIGPESPPPNNQHIVQRPSDPVPAQPTISTPDVAPQQDKKIVAVAPKPVEPELVPLPFSLPKPLFVGTPTNINVPRLEKPRGRPRPLFYAPKGTKNVALKKTVTSSDPYPIIGELRMITDGDKSAADGSYVELGPFHQHVTVDLQAEYEIYAILFWHYHKQARVYFDVVVQISSDPDFINAKTIYNNDHDNSSGLGAGNDLHYVETNEGRLVDAKGALARYVRIHSNGCNANDLNNFIEIEVWGRPLSTDDKLPETSKEHKKPQPDVEALPIELPKPMFVGTPTNIKIHISQRPGSYTSPVQTRPAPAQSSRRPMAQPRSPITVTRSKPEKPQGYTSPPPTRQSHYPMAHGGTTLPNGEAYDAMFFKNYGVNPFVDTEDDRLSTFATDVDTGSYTIARRYLQGGNLPPREAVRTEEFVNYFDYDYSPPKEDTFAVCAEACPWSHWTGRRNSYLLRLGLKAAEISEKDRKPAILTFVIDVSGSMNRQNRLGLVKQSLRMLVDRLRPKDKIGIAAYGSQGYKVLDHVKVKKKQQILAAIDSLQAGGSTFAEQGIRIGYEMAGAAYKKGYINRVILCSDGVANVGHTGPDQILQIIKDKADKGITLSALGFGMGNYNDVLLERLGDKGNGYYAYIDTLDQARRLFEDNLTGALQVVARDVKIQVDFNPDVVRSYRLIGYENRDVADNKFRDDKEDGGEIGAGHSVTALYEIKLHPDKAGSVATTYIRYKHPETRKATEFNRTFTTSDIKRKFGKTSPSFALAAVAAQFAEVLRESHWAKGNTLNAILEHTPRLTEEFDNNKDVAELIRLIQTAQKLKADRNSSDTLRENPDNDRFVAP